MNCIQNIFRDENYGTRREFENNILDKLRSERINDSDSYVLTAIDEFTRKRVLYIVDEKNVTQTSNFLLTLEIKMGFKIVTVQTDNGAEFINTSAISKKLSQYELTLEKLGIKHVRTQPYSPWQYGKVERSHRLDNDRLYSSAIFKSEKHIKKES